MNDRLRAASALAVLCLTVPVLAACGSAGGSTAADGSKKLVVATTVAPLTSIASAVGGDKVTIKGIVPEGTNSHTFEPAPKVAETLSDADVIFANGLKLEDPTLELAEKNKKAGAEIVQVGTLVIPKNEYIYDFSFPKSGGKPNPHLWTDPLYAIKYAEVIRQVLVDKDPANKAVYNTNAAIFTRKAKQLSNALIADQKTVPNGNLKLLTYHDAYAYFGKDYGWQIIGAVQPKSFEDPSAQEVARLIDQVKAEKVPTIFGSEVFPSNVLKEIGNATGARYEDTLRDDDLPGTPGDLQHSWLGLMRYDYITMIEGLGGTPTKLKAVALAGLAPDTADYPQ